MRLVRSGQSVDAFDSVSNGNSLTVTSVNSGSNPTRATGFDVVVTSANNVTADTTVTLRANSGSGSLGGTTTCTIINGTNSCTASGATWSAAESGAKLVANAPGHKSGRSAAFTVGKSSQSISFGAAPTIAYGGTGTVSATATSSLAVSYSSTTAGVCTISGTTVTAVTLGTCTIAANQAGDSNYAAASQVTQDITIGQGSQSITFNALGGKTLGDADFALSATSSASLTVAFASQTASVCTVSGTTAHLVAAGTCTLRASQAGNANYTAAANVDRSFTVASAPDPDPPAPTTVPVTGPNQTIQAVAGLPVEVAAGANVSNTVVNMPASQATTLRLGGNVLSALAQGANTRLTLQNVTVGGQSLIVPVLSAGAVRVTAGRGGDALLALGSGLTVVTAGGADASVAATHTASGTVLVVRSGFIVLPATAQTRAGHARAAAQSLTLYAGERAAFDAQGQVTAMTLASETGSGGAGDPVSIFGPANLHVNATVPKLDATSARLGKSVQQALSETLQATLAAGQSGGVLALDVAGTRMHVLPLGTVAIDTARADGAVLESDGQVAVTTQGITVRLAPAVADLAALANALGQALPGATLTVKADGVIVAAINGTTYALRPDWRTDSERTTGFASTTAGLLRYGQTDGTATLRPAVADWTTVATTINALEGFAATLDADGACVVTAGGRRWVLTPDYVTTTAPTGSAAWWADGNGKLYIRNGDGTAQGFAVR